ncbi:MAG: hypothetical protein R2745_18925 [Vicinamibacterales bacterium]
MRPSVRHAVRTGVLAAGLGAAIWLAGGALAATPSGRWPLVGVAPSRAALAVAMLLSWLVLRRASPVVRSAAAVPALLLAPLVAPWVPAAWLASGPGSLAIWAGAVASACRDRAPGGWLSGPRAAPAMAAVVAAAWLTLLTWFVGSAAMTGDAPHYLVITQSLLADGDLDVGNQYDAESYLPFFGAHIRTPHAVPTSLGQRYSTHAPGTALLVLPGFAVWGVRGAQATLVLLMALASGLFWRAVQRHTASAGAAWFAWAVLVASAPYALHAPTIFPDGPAAAAAIVGLWTLITLGSDRRLGLWHLALCSAPLAALPWLHVRYALVAGVLGAAVAWRLLWQRDPHDDRATRLAWWFMIPVISAAGWVAVTFVHSGSVDPTATMRAQYAPSPFRLLPVSLVGVLLDREFGVFAAAPVLAAALLGPRAMRDDTLTRWASTVLLAGVGLLVASWGWSGGRAAPGRLLAVVVPVAALAIGHVWRRAAPAGRQVLLLALVATATWTVQAARLDAGGRAYQSADGRLSVPSGLSTSVDLGEALPSLFQDDVDVGTEALIALVWVVAAVAGVAAISAAHGRLGEPAAWLAGTGSAAGAVALAATAAWGVRGAAPWTPSSAQLVVARAAAEAAMGLRGWPPLPVARAPVEGLVLATPEWVQAPPSTPLLVPNVPAGTYQVREADGALADGNVRQLFIGRDAFPIATWTRAADAPRVTLPVAVHSVRVGGAGATGALGLQPLALDPPVVDGEARRATRDGRVLVFSMDDRTDPEAARVWVRGDRQAQVVLAPADREALVVRLTCTAGPADVEVRLDGADDGGWHPLRAGESREIAVPLAPGTGVPIGIAVRGGFPAAALGGSPADSRWLGVAVSLSAAPQGHGGPSPP